MKQMSAAAPSTMAPRLAVQPRTEPTTAVVAVADATVPQRPARHDGGPSPALAFVGLMLLVFGLTTLRGARCRAETMSGAANLIAALALLIAAADADEHRSFAGKGAACTPASAAGPGRSLRP